MDFLPKTANLQGGDTRKIPNLANHGVRCRARVSPTRSLQSLPITAYHGISRHSLSILSNPNTLWIKPLILFRFR